MVDVNVDFTLETEEPVNADFVVQPDVTYTADITTETATNRHDELNNRDLPDQHPISAITDLQDTLTGLSEDVSAETEARQEADAYLQQQIDNLDISNIVGGSNIEVTEDNHVFTISTTTYTFEQGIASNTWTINHGLGKFPSVVVVDSANNVIEPDVEYVNENSVIVRFVGEMTGVAYLN